VQLGKFHRRQCRRPRPDYGSGGGAASDLGLLVNCIAASFASAGVHGGAVVTDATEAANTPLLAHPHMR
jgi:hypothetical protein